MQSEFSTPTKEVAQEAAGVQQAETAEGVVVKVGNESTDGTAPAVNEGGDASTNADGTPASPETPPPPTPAERLDFLRNTTPTVDKIADISHEDVINTADVVDQMAVEWMAAANKTIPPLELFKDMMSALDILEKKREMIRDSIQDEDAVDFDQFKEQAGFITELELKRQDISKRMDEVSTWLAERIEERVPQEIAEANTPEGAEAVQAKYGDNTRDGTEEGKFYNFIRGAAGTTFLKAAEMGKGSSANTLLNFLLTGAESGYGANNWDKNSGNEKEGKPIYDRDEFKKMLENQPQDIAKMLYKSITDETFNILRVGWQITKEERSKLEQLAGTTDAKTLQNELPHFLDSLNKFFARDPDNGVRWQKSREILAEAIPGEKGKGKRLDSKSGMDIFAFVQEKQWKHWAA